MPSQGDKFIYLIISFLSTKRKNPSTRLRLWSRGGSFIRRAGGQLGSSEMGMMGAEVLWIAGSGVAGALLLAWAWRAVEWVWWRPRRLERVLRAQGLRGTPYRLIFGDLKEEALLKRQSWSTPILISPSSHSIAPRVLPFLCNNINQHGKMSFTWFGPRPRVSIMDPELIREILSNKFGHFEKLNSNPFGRSLALGLATYEGEKWAKHRRIINPAFHLEKLKCMLPAFSACCDELINRWENFAGPRGTCELDVWPELQSFTGDVIAHTAFGSSYKAGRRIFQLQAEQAKLFIQAVQSLYIPGYRFLPTKKNNRQKEIRREIQGLLTSMIEQREKALRNGEGSKDDLLGLLLESNLRQPQEQGDSKNTGMTTEEVIGECKLFFFAGQETTSVLLTWTLLALSMHPIWQVRAREEVLQVFGNNKPDLDVLSRLKIVTMILYEVLRLYPPVAILNRKTCKEMKLGGIDFPPGVQLMLPILVVHHDAEFWGEDASEFKPERFSEGISKASKNQGAFFPFGWGPRICIGQSFAILEAKMGLARILQHFSFELSPSYAHAPHTVVTLQPQHGAQVILHKISS